MTDVTGRIATTRWSIRNRPHTYRLVLRDDPQYRVLCDVFGYIEEPHYRSREAIVDDFGDLIIVDKYTKIYNHTQQEH